jgi:hypothetical protein
LLQYLHKGNQTYAELELDPLLNFERLSKATIISMVTGHIKATQSQWAVWIGIWQRDNWSRNWFTAVHAKEARQSYRQGNVFQICSKSRTTKDVICIVKKKLAIFEVEGKRGANLESCCENLNSIPSNSVEPERFFFWCGRSATKIRSSLHDDSVDMLTFLRGYFKTENNWLLI